MAQRGVALVLAGRNTAELEAQATDLQVRYQTPVAIETFDALDFAGHAEFFQRCTGRIAGGLDGVVLCHGYLPNQQATQTDFAEAHRSIDANFTSAVSLLNLAAEYLATRRGGYIAAISSVAGDRGRQSNYTYGAAKAGLTAYLSGLRNRLQHAGVQVLTIKPGFVDTAMTQGLLNPNSPLVASPQRVARDIDRAIRSRRNTIYTPWFWGPIMLVIRSIPEFVFKRLRM
jgi:short-subunit dehydrogenase